MRKLSWVIMFIISLAVLLVITIISAPSFINWNSNKPIVEKIMAKYIGYDVKINGDLNVQILPNPMIYADSVIVKPTVGEKPLAEIKHIIINKDISDLLMLDFSIDSVTLNRPTVNFKVLENKNANWEPLKVKSSHYYSKKLKSLSENITKIKKLKIDNANINYINESSGLTKSFKGIYLTSMNKELLEMKVKANIKYLNSNNNLLATFDISNIEKIRTTISLTSNSYGFMIKGLLNNLYNSKGTVFIGEINSQVQDIDDVPFMNDKVSKIKNIIDFTDSSITSQLNISRKSIVVNNLEVSSKNNQFVGNLNIQNKEKKTVVKVGLNIDKIKVMPLNIFKENHNGRSTMSWNDDLIDFSFLNNIEFSTNIKCAVCYYGDLKLQRVEVKTNFQNNNLAISTINVNLENDSFLQLSGNARLNNPLAIDFKLKTQTFPISLMLFGLNEKLKGDITSNISGSSTGTTLKTIIAGLKGSFNIDSNNLSVSKIDSSGIANFIKSLNKDNYSEKLDNINASLSGILNNGVIRTSKFDFNFKNRVMKSLGKFDLANLTLNYRIEPASLSQSNLGLVLKGNINNLEVIEDKVTSKGVVDGYGRLVNSKIVKEMKRSELKTHFDYKDKQNLNNNIKKYLFENNEK